MTLLIAYLLLEQGHNGEPYDVRWYVGACVLWVAHLCTK